MTEAPEQIWATVDSAPEAKVIWTKIDDERGERNVQTLKRRGRMWWTPDDSFYVYYTPTHWAPITPPNEAAIRAAVEGK